MKLKRQHKIFLNKFWKNRKPKQRSFIVMVLLPTLIASLYYAFIASGLYVVESRFSVKGNELQQVDLLSGLAGIPAQGGSAADSYILQDYISSAEILRTLSQDIDLDAIFNRQNADWFSALGHDQTQQKLLDYWRERVSISYDPTTTISTLKTRAFSADDAKALAEAILHRSEVLVNDLSERARNDDLEFALAEVTRAEERVTKARLAMNDFRNESQDLDPTQTASAKMMLIGELEAQLAKAQAELNALRSYMDRNAPAVQNLQRQVNALTNQIHNEKKNISGDSSTQPALAGMFAEYEPLIVERTFAEKAYTSALASLEAARVEAARKHRYLATFVAPALPDEATEPYRMKKIATVFFTCLIAWAIGLLGIGIVKEHVGWV
ncbi:capsule biosynthesis protein [Vibrio sp. TRT 21S02]|uniref:capsule biosynthesis protein n=1 Tax=unclassified Vibrio TaxID=2614977 RepID=UPI003CEA6E3B